MFTTLRGQLIALSLLALVMIIMLGALAISTDSRLSEVLVNADGDAVALRNHMQSAQHQFEIAAYSEQLVAANKEGVTESIAVASGGLRDSAQNLRKEFAKNQSTPTLGQDIRDTIDRLGALVSAYALDAEKLTGFSNDAVELVRAQTPFAQRGKELGKEIASVRERIEGDLAESRTQAVAISNQTRLIVFTLATLGALLMGVLAWQVYQRVSSELDILEDTLQRVNAGDSDVRTQMVSGSELAAVGRSFDSLLDDRIAKFNATARESETVNDSVIGLIQTVFQLSNRDLTARANVTEDIIGTVSASINQLSSETSATLAEVQRIAGEVSTNSKLARAQAGLVEKTASNDRASLKSMAETLIEATQQLVQVAELSSQTNLVAAETTSATQSARTAVEGTLQGMDVLRTSIAETEKRFKRLAERTQEISSVVSLVNAISERTHVLSLNASMQAATAGEAGRGFALVAQEVQRLSDSSRQATAQISQLVTNIQLETNDTLGNMNRLIGEVVAQSELARSADVQMNYSEQSTAQLVGLVQQIADFSSHQEALASKLQSNVLDINEGTEQTSKAISEQTAATQTLVDFAKLLNDAVGQFKVKEAA